MSVLLTLFKYREREKRSPLEDFLSEVLAALINSLPRARSVALVRACFVPRLLWTHFDQIAAEGTTLARTQVTTDDRKRLDIVIEIEGRPVIVIENKLYSQFQMHRHHPSEGAPQQAGNNIAEEARADNQLLTYGRWIARMKGREDWPGVIALLTHATLPPSDFVDHSSSYAAIPHLMHWRGIHSYLSETSPNDGHLSDDATWFFLLKELKLILEAHQMDSTDMNSRDIAALNIYMSAGRRFKPAMAEISSDILSRYPGEFTPTGASYEIDEDDSRAWGWTYFQGRKFYVSYGLYFSPIIGDFQQVSPPLPEFEHAFISVGAEANELKLPGDGLPSGWHVARDGYYVVKPLSLSGMNGRRFPEFIRDEIAIEMGTMRAIFTASA